MTSYVKQCLTALLLFTSQKQSSNHTIMKASELKQIRLQLHMTQTELAELMGYSNYQRISEKERGRRAITARDAIILKSIRSERMMK